MDWVAFFERVAPLIERLGVPLFVLVLVMVPVGLAVWQVIKWVGARVDRSLDRFLAHLDRVDAALTAITTRLDHLDCLRDNPEHKQSS